MAINLSIIIPTKDRRDLLQAMLGGLGVPDGCEVIVVDTGEKDSALWAATRGFRGLVRPGATFAQACNAGVKATYGSHLLLLNDDLVLPPDFLRDVRILSLFHAFVVARLVYPQTGLIQHAGVGFDMGGNPYNLWHLAPSEHPEVMKPRFVAAGTFACVYMERRTWTALDGLDERYLNAFEDVDFCLRARECNIGVRYVPWFTAGHYAGQSAGRHDRDAESWAVFKETWIDTGRLWRVLGVWPFERMG